VGNKHAGILTIVLGMGWTGGDESKERMSNLGTWRAFGKREKKKQKTDGVYRKKKKRTSAILSQRKGSKETGGEARIWEVYDAVRGGKEKNRESKVLKVNR